MDPLVSFSADEILITVRADADSYTYCLHPCSDVHEPCCFARMDAYCSLLLVRSPVHVSVFPLPSLVLKCVPTGALRMRALMDECRRELLSLGTPSETVQESLWKYYLWKTSDSSVVWFQRCGVFCESYSHATVTLRAGEASFSPNHIYLLPSCGECVSV